MSEDEMLKLLATDGMLVKRPLLVSDEFVLVGFKETEWTDQLKNKSERDGKPWIFSAQKSC